jgi:hypothetical protein
MRTVKQDVKLLKDIKDELFSEFSPDGLCDNDMLMFHKMVIAVFENQNKWLLSDKISSEKQGRMDSFKASKEAQGSNYSGDPDAPTPRQISYATMLGIEVEGKNYTKKQLSDLIDKANKKESHK